MIEKVPVSPTGALYRTALAVWTFFIASAGDFREKIFSEWINIYLALFAKPFSAVPRFFPLLDCCLMWKQIFNQDSFICEPFAFFFPLSSLFLPPFLLHNKKAFAKKCFKLTKKFPRIYSQMSASTSPSRWCEKLIFRFGEVAVAKRR